MSFFTQKERPMVTVMVQGKTKERVVELMEKAHALGADAFGVQLERLCPADRTEKSFRTILHAACGKPVYFTDYRMSTVMPEQTDEERVGEMLTFLDLGGTLFDIPTNLYDPDLPPVSYDPDAVARQKQLAAQVHARGGEVLFSTHTAQRMRTEEVLTLMQLQRERGADVTKVVCRSDRPDDYTEALRTEIALRQAGLPALFLTTGDCAARHRRTGPLLGGSALFLCVCEHDELATPAQPELTEVQKLLSGAGFPLPAPKTQKGE